MMTSGERGPAARAERVRSAYQGEDPYDGDREWERTAGGGLTRILMVVILLHVAGIAGVLGYRWVHRSGGETGREAFRSTPAERPAVEELIPQPRTNGKAILVEHPTLKGHIRYRVGSGEQLIDVARRFNASVAEVEKLNSLRTDSPLYPGQWLTVPDHRQRLSDGTPVDPQPAGPEPGKKPVAGTAEPLRPRILGPAPQPKKVETVQPIAPPAAPDVPPGPALVQPGAPPAPPPAPKIVQPAPAPLPPAGGGETYKVNAGDTAYRIALRHGITWQELLEYNGMTDPKQLKAGQVLKIPAKR